MDWTKSGIFQPHLPYGCPLKALQMVLDSSVLTANGKYPVADRAITIPKLGQYLCIHCIQPLRSQNSAAMCFPFIVSSFLGNVPGG